MTENVGVRRHGGCRGLGRGLGVGSVPFSGVKSLELRRQDGLVARGHARVFTMAGQLATCARRCCKLSERNSMHLCGWYSKVVLVFGVVLAFVWGRISGFELLVYVCFFFFF